MSRNIRRTSDATSESTVGFVFYDPYYEELLRRKRVYDAQAKSVSAQKPSTPKQASPTHRSLAIHSPPRRSTVSDFLSDEIVQSRRRDSAHSPSDLIGELKSKEEDLKAASLKIEQCERVVKSLYADLDRQKALVSESMDREARAAKALVAARRTSDHVPLQEFREMESRFLNAVKIIDELNLKLYQLTNPT